MAIVAASVASAIGVFALNFALTGTCQFSSIAHKGYFTNLAFPSAVYASAIDAMKIAKAYLLGMPQDAPRDFFYLPFVGAAFLWIGVFSRSWSTISWREGVWYLAVAGGCATVATSGWQNTNLDRYLIWIMPVLLFSLSKENVTKLPIPKITDENKKIAEEIENLVDKITQGKKALEALAQSKTASPEDIKFKKQALSYLEKAIDKKVYELYSLTDEEIAIVEKG